MTGPTTGATAATPAVTPKPVAPPVYVPGLSTSQPDVPCSQPDPFKARGGVGMCVSGKWIALWMPGGSGKSKK